MEGDILGHLGHGGGCVERKDVMAETWSVKRETREPQALWLDIERVIHQIALSVG